MQRFLILNLFIITALLISCKNNKLDIDISDIETNQKVKRFEKDLFEFDKVNTERLKSEYGDFYINFVENILSLGPVDDLGVEAGLESFTEDKTMIEVYDKINEKYSDFTTYENDILDAFKRYRYHFPEKKIPNIITYMSGFNYALGATENDIAVGLDMYLGSDCSYYERLGYPKYKSVNMNDYNMVIDCLKGWVMTEFYTTENDESTLLSKMIYEGKILYLLDAVYPNKADSVKIGFSEKEITWCNENEFNLWSHFVDKQLLYSKNGNVIVQYTGEGPFTTGLDKASPARVGVWMGWQIVRQFMEKNDKVLLQQLMDLNDAQILLTKSGYKPKK